MKESLFSLQSSFSLNQAFLSTEKSMYFTRKETLPSQFISEALTIQKGQKRSQTQESNIANNNNKENFNRQNRSKLQYFLGIDQNQQYPTYLKQQIHESKLKFIEQTNCNPFFSQIINNFDIQSYLDKIIMHKKRCFFGKSHLQQLINPSTIKKMLYKTLTNLNINDQLEMFQIVKTVNLFGNEEKLLKALTLLQKTLLKLSNTSEEVRKQCYLRLINLTYHKSILYAVRMYQLLIVFAHTFDLDFDSMIFLIKIFKAKLTHKNLYKQEINFMKHIIYIFQKKMERKEQLLYLPISYQVVSLLSFNKIDIPFFMPTGRPIMLPVESRQTFKDIKHRLLKQFGVQNMNPSFFRFMRIEKYQQEVQEFYIGEDSLVWDQMSYIYYLTAQAKRQQDNINLLNIFLILKLAFPLGTTMREKQEIDILYSNIYLDYCLGKFQLTLQQDIQAYSLFTYMNKTDTEQRLYPKRLSKIIQNQPILQQTIKNHQKTYGQLNLQVLKRKAISLCIKQFNSQLKFYITHSKPYDILINYDHVQFITTKGDVIKSIPLQSISQWNLKGNICELYLHPPHKNQIIISKDAHLLCDYLNNYSTLFHANLIK